MDSAILTFAFSILCRKMECAKVSFVILRKDDNKTPVKLNNMIYILADTEKSLTPSTFAQQKDKAFAVTHEVLGTRQPARPPSRLIR